MNYPSALIGIEKEISLGELKSVLMRWFMIPATGHG